MQNLNAVLPIALSGMVLSVAASSHAAAEVLLDDCEAVGAWSGEAAKALSPEAKVGKGCLAMTMTSAMSAYPGLSRQVTHTDWSKYDVLTFWLKADMPTTYFQTVLHDQRGTMAECGLSAPLPAGRWRFIVWPYQVIKGWVHGANQTFDYTAVGAVRLYIERPTTPGADVTFTVDDVRLLTMAEVRSKLREDSAARAGNAALFWSVLPQPDPAMLIRYFRQAVPDRTTPPRTEQEARRLSERVRHGLLESARPEELLRCPLDPRLAGKVEGEGFVIEKILLQTRPEGRMPLLVYRPAQVKGRVPAILRLPGHSEPPNGWQVQQQGISLAKRGYVYAAVEVFGSGERGELLPAACAHGGLPANALWTTGTSLFGLLLLENMRAVDYLISRTDVDKERIGATGVSGGGSHTLWLMAADPRIKVGVAVASGLPDPERPLASFCECDLPLGYFRYGSDQEVLGAIAPRPLLRIYPSSDTPGLAEEQLHQRHQFAASVYQVLGAGDRLRVTRLEGQHGYYVNYQEAALGWFDRYLKGEGDGSPRKLEPELFYFKEDTPLLFFPNFVRPDGFVLPSEFLRRRIEGLVRPLPSPPANVSRWERTRGELKQRLADLLSIASPQADVQSSGVEMVDGYRVERLLLKPEPEVQVPAILFFPGKQSTRLHVAALLHPGGKGAVADRELRAELVNRNWAVLVADLRGTGETRATDFEVGAYMNQRDMAFAKAAFLLGRPGISMWLTDIMALVNMLSMREDLDLSRLSLYGYGETGTAVLLFAALDGRATTVVTERALGSYLSESGFGRPFIYKEPNPTAADGGGIGSMIPFVPGLLKLADVPEIAALVAPRRLAIVDAVRGDGRPMDFRYARRQYTFASAAFVLTGGRFDALNQMCDSDLADLLTGAK